MAKSWKPEDVVRDIRRIATTYPEFLGMSPSEVLRTLVAAAKNDPGAVAHVESARLTAERVKKWTRIFDWMKTFPGLAHLEIDEICELYVKAKEGDRAARQIFKDALGDELPPGIFDDRAG